ncbi:hypothetical protein [Pseudofrankia sp. BMG5.36]|uniref:NAD(P)/FAD-dependent oxidoreductase n=1 Tax=Pseudofrankia sp. BMG5.36 TaxID=1834512 RepID=UPI0008D9C7E0|nr:hypothetical protein [Pseudofrankia sp. BMG5.36]OHV62982.1 hypothetical protein BCD48_38800 [Pseudofrankia sp. BMG5.36]
MADARGRRAVVLGGGFAGLLAARVLSEEFDRVTIVERDPTPSDEYRRGAPQGRHLHGLLERGRQILDEFYPGFTEELVDRGAPTTEVLVGSRWYFAGRRAWPRPTGLTTVLASRPLLETVLRERTMALPGVHLMLGVSAVGLVVEPVAGGAGRGQARVIGARVTAGADAPPDGVPGTIEADIVVDATGWGTRAPHWLAALGLAHPPEERFEVDLGYASRLYRREPGHLGGDLSVIMAAVPRTRGGGAIALDSDRWHVTLAGMLGDHPPIDPAGFEAFSATLPGPEIHDLIRTAVPLTDPVPHRFAASARRRYELLPTAPDGFVAFGDALCSLNPLYALGMTVTAQQALALRASMAGGAGRAGRVDGLARRFHRRAAAVIDIAWTMTTGSDLRYPAVAGRRDARTRLVNAYVARAQVAAHRDPAVALALVRTRVPSKSLFADQADDLEDAFGLAGGGSQGFGDASVSGEA